MSSDPLFDVDRRVVVATGGMGCLGRRFSQALRERGARLVSAHALDARRVVTFAVEGYPACGMPTEVLKFHGLDGASLPSRILQQLNEA